MSGLHQPSDNIEIGPTVSAVDFAGKVCSLLASIQLASQPVAKDRALNSDQLGTKGESTFELLCADAGLVANKSSKDRGGWDYVVEFPVINDKKSKLDERSNPISCLFQIKALWSDNDRVKFRLSSLERIAKDHGPTFILFLKVNDDLTIAQVYLLELRGDVLADVLKALRTEREAGRFAINNANFYLYVSAKTVPIAHTGLALREAIAKAVPAGQDIYEQEKKRELKELGYGEQPFEMKVEFSVNNKSEFADVMLGIKEIVPTKIEHFETRFGIRMQTAPPWIIDGLKFQPFPVDTCEIIAKKNKFSEPASFQGSIFLPPKTANLGTLVRIASEFCELTYRDQSFKMTIKEMSEDLPRLTPLEWNNLFRFIENMTTEGSTLEVIPKAPYRKKIVLRGAAIMHDYDNRYVIQGAETSRRLDALWRMTGRKDVPKIGNAMLWKQASMIGSAHATLANSDNLSPLTFTIGSEIPSESGVPIEGYCINYIAMDNQLLVWSANVTVKRVGTSMRDFESTSFELDEIVAMPVDEYRDYVNEHKKNERGMFVMSREIKDLEALQITKYIEE